MHYRDNLHGDQNWTPIGGQCCKPFDIPGFDLDLLGQVGRRVRDLFTMQTQASERVNKLVDDRYIEDLARAVAGQLGGRVGVAPRLFLKKLVADVLDRVDQFSDFDPRRHYAPTLAPNEITPAERAATPAGSVDDVELDL